MQCNQLVRSVAVFFLLSEALFHSIEAKKFWILAFLDSLAYVSLVSLVMRQKWISARSFTERFFSLLIKRLVMKFFLLWFSHASLSYRELLQPSCSLEA